LGKLEGTTTAATATATATTPPSAATATDIKLGNDVKEWIGVGKQIISLGAGFDTTYFRLKASGFAPTHCTTSHTLASHYVIYVTFRYHFHLSIAQLLPCLIRFRGGFPKCHST
jgi:hypothetical protein